MVVRRRQFNGSDDLRAMQGVVMERTRVMGPCSNLHPGDVAHRIYSGLRGKDLSTLVPVWECGGDLIAFGIIWPRDSAFDVVVRPGLGNGAYNEVVGDIAEMASRGGTVSTDVIGTDREFTGVLAGLGFSAGLTHSVFARAELARDMERPRSAHEVRSVTTEDVEQLAAVHSGAFGSHWTASTYAQRMTMPGYDPDNEVVVVDEEGTFMGLAITWYDDVNKVGYLEPVGVHSDFHRRGIGSRLLAEAEYRMKVRGMETATVWHLSTDARAAAFYRSNGFTAINDVIAWERP